MTVLKRETKALLYQAGYYLLVVPSAGYTCCVCEQDIEVGTHVWTSDNIHFYHDECVEYDKANSPRVKENHSV